MNGDIVRKVGMKMNNEEKEMPNKIDIEKFFERYKNNNYLYKRRNNKNVR